MISATSLSASATIRVRADCQTMRARWNATTPVST